MTERLSAAADGVNGGRNPALKATFRKAMALPRQALFKQYARCRVSHCAYSLAAPLACSDFHANRAAVSNMVAAALWCFTRERTGIDPSALGLIASEVSNE